jgi:hypothetical protein
MPSVVSHQTTGVKYVWTFNQDVDTGTFWDGSPYVIAKPDLKLLSVVMETADGVLEPNTIVPDLELGFMGKEGFKGELYINGLAKNPVAYADYDQNGNKRLTGNVFDCRNFGAFNRGWTKYKRIKDASGKYVKIPVPTNLPSSHDNTFNLNKFLEMHNTLRGGGGVSLESGDVLVQQYSNFDINCPWKWDVSYAGGYPYQKLYSRSCSMSYGTLFVLESHPAEVSFRPPVLWPEEDYKNRPIHAVSKLNETLPTGDDLVPHPISGAIPTYERVPTYENDPSFRTFCYTFGFGSGNTYSQTAPLLTASKTANLNAQNVPHAYGAYYQIPLYNRLAMIYSDVVPSPLRLEALKCIVQWGIDAFGAIKSFAPLGSGAGQKPGTSRSWSIIAGHFLGQPAMRMPESLMLQDTKRSAGFLGESAMEGDVDEEELAQGDGFTINWSYMPELYGKKVTWAQRDKMLYGDINTLLGKKRRLARWNGQEGITYYKVVNDPNNYLLHHGYLGVSHRRRFTGEGGIFTNTKPEEKVPLPRFNAAGSITGNFAKMQWMNNLTPGLVGAWPASHDGKPGTFLHCYIKVTDGPGAGDTLYRVIYTFGTIRTANASGSSTDPMYLGYGFVLNKPWANGVPDQTSKFEMMTATEENVGDVFYVISPSVHSPLTPDANLSPDTAYAPICEDLIIPQYGWMNYIKNKTGTNPDLDADSTFAHEYCDKMVNQMPYNLVSIGSGYSFSGNRQWEMAVHSKWFGKPNGRVEIAKTMDWSKIPGAQTWFGIAVGGAEAPLVGDLNNDGEIDGQDMAILLSRWGTNDADADLNDDGVVDVADITTLQSNWGKKKKT